MKTRTRSLLYLALLLGACNFAWSQQAPGQAAPANVAGKWTLYCNDPNGSTSAKYLELQQTGSSIKGHFKGPNQSGSVTGTIDIRHLVIRTNTRAPLVFRGRIDGPVVNDVVQGGTFTGTFHDRGGQGTFQGTHTQ
jgi:hypothetical protein